MGKVVDLSGRAPDGGKEIEAALLLPSLPGESLEEKEFAGMVTERGLAHLISRYDSAIRDRMDWIESRHQPGDYTWGDSPHEMSG